MMEINLKMKQCKCFCPTHACTTPDGKDSANVPSLLSSDRIDVITVVVTIIDNATIALAADSTANAEVETLPFNF